VIIWDNGTWEFVGPGDDPVKALEGGELKFRMNGKKMFGEWALFRIKGRSPKGNEWLLVKHRDQFANNNIDITEIAPKSVVSNRTLEDVDASRTWQSNRPASSGKKQTLAARLEAENASKKSSKKRSTRPAKRPRAASARTRSSPAQSPRKSRPTPRRRPR
jgi:hypothetical protein